MRRDEASHGKIVRVGRLLEVSLWAMHNAIGMFANVTNVENGLHLGFDPFVEFFWGGRYGDLGVVSPLRKLSPQAKGKICSHTHTLAHLFNMNLAMWYMPGLSDMFAVDGYAVHGFDLLTPLGLRLHICLTNAKIGPS